MTLNGVLIHGTSWMIKSRILGFFFGIALKQAQHDFSSNVGHLTATLFITITILRMLIIRETENEKKTIISDIFLAFKYPVI